MVVDSQKGTFFIPEFREHSLKISWKSVDNSYLFLFYGKLKKCTEKVAFNFSLGN